MSSLFEFHQWWEKNGKLFVSHATFNSEFILKDKVLKCAEEVFRVSGSVDHESVGGSGVRDLYKNPHIKSGNIYQYLMHSLLPNEEGFTQSYIIPEFTIPSGIVKKLERQFPEHLMEDKGDYIKFSTVKECLGVGCYDAKMGELSYDSEDTINRFYHYSISNPSKTTSYFSDELEGRKIDVSLRKIYQDSIQDKCCPDRLGYELTALRYEIFTDLNPQIRVAKNSVYWTYGDIVFLIGDVHKRLFSSLGFNESFNDRKEFSLRQPFQVENGFYQVDLTDPSVVIVGKEEAVNNLKRNSHVDPDIKARIFNIKDLNESPFSSFINSALS